MDFIIYFKMIKEIKKYMEKKNKRKYEVFKVP